TRTHYRRLVTTFLLAALAPLTLLTLALTNFVRSEVSQDVIEHGWTVLGSLRHQVEDFGLVQEFGGIPDDAYLYSLTEESAEELSLFTDGVLRATSDREMYDLGIQPRRLSGDVQRRVELEGRRVVLDQVRIGHERYHRIHGVVSLGPPHDGILSILLASESPEIARRARQIYDVMLIAYASVIFVMGLVAYVLARRIARPIRHLSQAAARIATGDLRAEVTSTARDETGDLVESFNAMARALRRQRDALEERGNYIEKILLNATTGVLSVDLLGKLVTFNPIAASLLGIEGLSVGADLPARLETREDCAPVAQALRSCLQIPSRTREVEAELGGGEEKRNVRVKIVPFTEGAGLLIFLEDVTETVRSNRLAMWAEMARRIAHEIKNPLTPIKLSADHIRRVFADHSADFPRVLGECLRTIDEQIENLRVIAKQFSAYARHPEIRKEAIPVREFLEDVIRPYRVAPPPGVTVECDFGEEDGTAQIDRTILSQALVNMIENSLQAMPAGGRLALRASASPAAGGKRMLTIEIADTGVGMDRNALARAFEPYFSTKGSGTGLGMAIARRAVEEHQGTIDLASEPQQGTTARITIPLD
ncbi:MAG TPA: ATP-binding protein, partial [Candidatus Saccharimonadales bacterium]|nr:ATP-binding protein [Candidatus Saccharimonadales bacterium]